MKTGASVGHVVDFMTSPVYALRPEMPARHAARALIRRGFSGAPVVNADKELVGIVSEADLVRTLANAAFNDAPVDTVANIMKREVVTVAPGADLFRLSSLMGRSGVRRVPVMAEGRLVGIVARRDLLGALAHMCDQRCTEHLPGTIDALAELEQIHNPFPRSRLRRPR